MKLIAALVGLSLVALAGTMPARAQSSDDQTETKIGQQEYQQLQQKGEIIGNSPYYAILNPIAQQIKRVADPQYFHPFQFILVHETQPNAFAVPGGNVYVTDSLMKFVQNREELAGVLCHETSHNIHHDVLHLYQKQQKAATAYTIGDILANLATGGKYSGAIDTIASYSFQFQTLRYSRDVEAAADAKGAITCAQAGSNPWGMVWLFKRFETINTNSPPNFLSDHPSDQARIAALQNEFQSDPALFGRYSSNIAAATQLTAAAPRAAAARTTAYKPAAKKGKGMFPPGSGYKF
jgi:beta-barrel assembly-enhancing protease